MRSVILWCAGAITFLELLIAPRQVVLYLRGRYEASGLVVPLAGAFLVAFCFFVFISSPERQLLGRRGRPLPLWRDALRLALSWAVMSAIIITVGIDLDLAATDGARGMSTAAVAVFSAPMVALSGALLVYAIASIQRSPTRRHG